MAKDDTTTAALAALRRRIDEVDDGLHDLLIRRTELVEEVGRVKHHDDVAAFRPGREAQVLRRLVSRHRGRFPRGAVVRIWREIIAGAVAMQAEISVAVCAGCWDLARDHFGSQMPLLAVPSSEEAANAVAEGRATLGVLPLAEEDVPEPWWLKLGALAERGPSVVARLPFGALGNATGAYDDAFVIAAMTPEPSGDDCTLLAIEAAVPGTAALTDAFLDARLDVNPIARRARDGRDAHLVEVEALVEPGDGRLARALDALGDGARVAWLGLYARPLPDAVMGGVAPA
ncbi:MAG TPA: chorismate mutase [Stellaceae bacterium]|nr:chorismate mutase [Stellaceae bacterium]